MRKKLLNFLIKFNKILTLKPIKPNLFAKNANHQYLNLILFIFTISNLKILVFRKNLYFFLILFLLFLFLLFLLLLDFGVKMNKRLMKYFQMG